MAIDMGVSPHAIEKRLKMARTKLGVSSSLQASRLLAASEGYQAAIPQPSDVDVTLTPREFPGRQSMALGAILMSITVVVIFSVMLNTIGPAAESVVIPKPGEIIISGPSTFEELDKDQSGFLEGGEAPSLLQVGGKTTYKSLPDGRIEVAGDYLTISDSKTLRDRFYFEADINHDGKVSSAEFKGWTAPEDK